MQFIGVKSDCYYGIANNYIMSKSQLTEFNNLFCWLLINYKTLRTKLNMIVMYTSS